MRIREISRRNAGSARGWIRQSASCPVSHPKGKRPSRKPRPRAFVSASLPSKAAKLALRTWGISSGIRSAARREKTAQSRARRPVPWCHRPPCQASPRFGFDLRFLSARRPRMSRANAPRQSKRFATGRFAVALLTGRKCGTCNSENTTSIS